MLIWGIVGMMLRDRIKTQRLSGNVSPYIFDEMEKLESECFTYERQSAESLRADVTMANKIIICAFLKGDRVESILAGFICGFFAADQSDITSIAVYPEYRRMGIADCLMNEFEKYLPKIIESIFLEVRESNIVAQSLYTKHGFEKISVRKNYYERPDENAVVMRKAIN